nr:MAG TPA_asm: hypothetical protein [Caudoviricetes sp.]
MYNEDSKTSHFAYRINRCNMTMQGGDEMRRKAGGRRQETVYPVKWEFAYIIASKHANVKANNAKKHGEGMRNE